MKKYIIILIILIILLVAVASVSKRKPLVLPIQDNTPTPTAITTPTDISDKSNMIRLTSPRPGETVKSPLTITGEARGNWFFEASFPVAITNWDGLIIGEGIATAQGEWMTSEFVPFTAVLNFNSTSTATVYSKKGTLILKKDNPSGLPEHDDALEIPVVIE